MFCADAITAGLRATVGEQLLARVAGLIPALLADAGGGSANAHDVVIAMRRAAKEMQGQSTEPARHYAALLETRYTVFRYARPATRGDEYDDDEAPETQSLKKTANRKRNWNCAATAGGAEEFTPADARVAAVLSAFNSPRLAVKGADKDAVAAHDCARYEPQLRAARAAIQTGFDECRAATTAAIVATQGWEAGGALPACASVGSMRVFAAAARVLGEEIWERRLSDECGCSSKDLISGAGLASYALSEVGLTPLHRAGRLLEPHVSCDEMRVARPPSAGATYMETAAAACAADTLLLPVYRAVAARIAAFASSFLRVGTKKGRKMESKPAFVQRMNDDIVNQIFSRNRVSNIVRALLAGSE
jgi:hypothetical protein